MFTGIIQAKGVIRSIRPGSNATRLVLEAPDLPRPIAYGASICVSGVCLTVARSDQITVEFDVVPETLTRSKLGRLKSGDRVNLEPSLRVGDPMDGHIVQGHVDGLAVVRDIRTGEQGVVANLEVDRELMKYVAPKGSIALDGVSLTVAEVMEDGFTVAWIPTTLELTTLSELRRGDQVNIETDMVARTIVAYLQRQGSSGKGTQLSVDMLRRNGW
jgi:riboflavin synthase